VTENYNQRISAELGQSSNNNNLKSSLEEKTSQKEPINPAGTKNIGRRFLQVLQAKGSSSISLFNTKKT
jgi:hypothetical protein